ncbi:NADH dehydrogenase [ubiquinone] 1 alpha subcomplex subunit 10, mitochondrial [Anabrus simplex]|uniref:NADH dehydrogenase [ubiquinone] 1 alpha subcomplex subunit 10, mitochondrial n=1 Tax=Anabrus simplex TaxID=316456 RepID=UPI0034DDA691
MAWICVRTNIGKLLNGYQNQSNSLLKPFKKVNKAQPLTRVQSANISGKALRDPTKKRPTPWPYKEKKYTFLQALFDHTTHRFDENSKIIVVEGPIASGKTEFAKCLAEDLDMLHLPEVTMDMFYINSYNYDLRQLDTLLPESCKSYDVKSFCQNPKHENTARFQIQMYQLRYSQYIDALAHVLSTGQGVVLERCAYSDFVFVETMFKSGYISKGAKSVYYELVKNTITEIMRPHLVIYLDIPVAKVQERIKKRNVSYEVNSKVFTPQYLTTMEEVYKQHYLKDISSHAELLVYDWSEKGDVEVVVEDIERIDFDRFDKNDNKMKDWRMAGEWDWKEARMLYASEKNILMNYFNVPRFDVPELTVSPNEAFVWHKVMNNAPGNKYTLGYNADMGDTGILFKRKLEFCDTK